MKKQELKVEYVPKEALKTYANNAKVHTPAQIEGIKKSITEFGFNDPIAVWKDNEIIEGHGRLLAAMEMEEIKEVPIIRLDGLTDTQRKAYIIAHNKLTLTTQFDNDILAEELKAIAESMDEAIDMTDFGFGEFELNILTGDFEPEPFSKEIEEAYSAHEEDLLAKKRVIITYVDEQLDDVLKLLHIEKLDKVVYDITEVMGDEVEDEEAEEEDA